MATIRGVLLLFGATCLVAAAAVAGPTPSVAPRAPEAVVDTTYPAPTGRTVAVSARDDLQAALNAARPGDLITLEAGATYAGPFTLPDKPGAEWIVVRTNAADDRLPPPGQRVDPSHAAVMPKLVSASGPVIKTAPGAHHYRFVGIEVRPREGAFLHNLVQLGLAERSLTEVPHHIVVDRCYLHGDAVRGTRRGIALNSRFTAVIDSYLADFKEVGADSQAIGGWNGPGPFKIVNNHLEGAGENLMFGGADPSIGGLVPSDIEIRRNHLAKPRAWKIGDPAYQGTPWTIKNLFELKNARRVLVEGNVFERNWAQAQNGFAILFTVRNQDGAAPWSVVEDVKFVNNVVRHVGAGVNILGRDDLHPSQPTRRVSIRNNLFEDVGGAEWAGGGRLFQLLAETTDVVIEHNTATQTGAIVTVEGGPHKGFVYRDNIAPHNEYGIIGTGTGPGKPTIDRYFPDARITRNVIAGGRPAPYPAGNAFPASLEAVGFARLAEREYRLGPSSRFRRAGTDGADIGVDVRALCGALNDVRDVPSCRGAG